MFLTFFIMFKKLKIFTLSMKQIKHHFVLASLDFCAVACKILLGTNNDFAQRCSRVMVVLAFNFFFSFLGNEKLNFRVNVIIDYLQYWKFSVLFLCLKHTMFALLLCNLLWCSRHAYFKNKKLAIWRDTSMPHDVWHQLI